MNHEDKILKETSPLSVFFVKSGSGGNKLLFRYPYDEELLKSSSLGLGFNWINERDRAQMQNVISESDEALCNIFSVNPNLCGHKLEIKINNVRYVCHPMSLLSSGPSKQTNESLDSNLKNPISSNHTSRNHPHRGHRNTHNGLNKNDPSDSTQGDITSFNIVFALRSSASYDIVDCFHDLSKRLAIALCSEERRCSYLSREIKNMMVALDEREIANLNKQVSHSTIANKNTHITSEETQEVTENQNVGSVYSAVLNRSGLAKDLKRMFISSTFNGIVELKINSWIHLSFCLPQKVHRLKLMTHRSMPAIGTSDIKRCLMYLRPYHGVSLLVEPQELLETLPIDASPALIQLIKVAKPDKNFMDLSVDANLTLKQIYCIVAQLIYWARATIIYPICDSNMYSIHPLASTALHSELVNEFRNKFPQTKSLHHYLADFSEGVSLSQLNGPLLNIDERQNLFSVTAWLLQRRILTQMHKYIFMVADDHSNYVDNTDTGLVNNNISQKGSDLVGDSDNGSQAIVALQKAGLTLTAAKNIAAIPSSRNPEDLRLLISLFPYFDGKHHIEDIMFFENLDRSQVLILCDKYRDILLTCHYEDIAVSQFCPFNNNKIHK